MSEQKIFPFSFEKASKQVGEFKKWEEDPVKYEGSDKKVLTKEEYGKVKDILVERFHDQIINSSLSTGKDLKKTDLDLVHKIQDSVMEEEEKIVPDEKRRPWNESCHEHSRQVETFAKVMAEEINKKNPNIDFDVDKIAIKAAVHDIGRFASHDAVIHGLAGRKLLKELGFASEFRATTMAHLEAGVGPYITDIDETTWKQIEADKESLQNRITDYSPEELIIALADMAKIGKVGDDGKFHNEIADPSEGVTVSASRRPGEKADMYIGFAQALKDYAENKFSINFSGETGIVEKAKNLYNQGQ